MKTTDFAQCLFSYLTMYLPAQAGLSENTIMSYRDTFKLVLQFAETVLQLRPETFVLTDFNAGFVERFMLWLENERGNGIATRNQRLTALRAFAKYARTKYPEFLLESQKILDMKAKKSPASSLAYLHPDAVNAIIRQTDSSTQYGRRDMLLLSLMYDSAARVQEVCDLCVRDVRLQKPYSVTLHGKGNKTRTVPIMTGTAKLLSSYIAENKLNVPQKADSPLFFNHQHNNLTRAGVAYILKKYCHAVHAKDPTIPQKVSPHVLRHSKAMHLLQAGVNLVYIRDFLGHVHVETTEIYAKADTEMKRKVLEETQILADPDLPAWTDDQSLMAMLTRLCGKD